MLPEGIVSTDAPATIAVAERVGLRMDQWQKDITRITEARLGDGSRACDFVCLSIPRQAGKTWVVAAIVLAICLRRPTTVAWTAHHNKVMLETFRSLKSLAETELLKPHVLKVNSSAEDRSITFANGSRLVMAARESGALRGVARLDVLVLDEAQILSESGMADILPTQNASQQPLTLMMGTPPKPKDPSEVFSAQRELALAAEKGGRAPELMAWVEFSAEEDADSDDLAQLRRANPSYPHRTPLRAIRKLRRALSEDSFRREALGIWDDKSTPSVVPPSTWSSLADEHSVATRKWVLALDVSLDRDRASVALAGLRGDDLVHMELDELGGGVDWVVDWVVGRCETNPIVAMVIDAKGPASSLASELRRRLRKSRVPLLLLNSQEVTDACADWLDEVRAGRVRHIGQPQLTGPLHGARKLSVGERWVWNGKSETRDITPIRAVTLATWGVLSNRVRAERGKGVVMSW